MKKYLIGFTLMELMIALAILGIITTIATISYSSYVRKSRRVDAVNVLLSLSLAQEKYRGNNVSYGSLSQVWSGGATSPEGYYSIAVSNNTATGYTLTATAQGTQANDAENGTSCATLILSLSNGTITKSPSACWPT